MDTNTSLDPRVNRLDRIEGDVIVTEHEEWPTFEVFHQPKSGKPFVHVGSIHAPDAELALVLSKEQYGRRGTTHNIWVAKTADIFTFNGGEAMFDTVPEKTHREAIEYRVRDRIQAFKAKQQ